MSEMIRKQIYISRRQEQLLKRLSQARGMSEAEIVRRAIDRELQGEPAHQQLVYSQPSAFEEFIQLARTPRDLTGEPIHWNRAEVYAERENRWSRQVTDGEPDAASPD